MAFLDTLKQTLETTGQKAAETAKRTTDILKLKEQIRQNKKEIHDLVYQIGRTYMQLHSDDYEAEYAAFFQEIDAIKKDIADQEKMLDEIKSEENTVESDSGL